MSEQEQAPVEEPENAAPSEETGTPTDQQSVDYEKRYNDMRSEFDRRGSRVTELERYEQAVTDLRSEDADTRNRAAQSLGLPFEFVDETPTDDDPTPYLTREEWQAYQAQQTQREQEAQAQAEQQAQIAQIDQTIQSHEGLNALDQDDRDWVIAKALSINPKMGPDGKTPLPDIDTALESFKGWDSGRWERARKSKRAPHIGQVGTAGTPALPEDADHNARVAYALERLQADQ